MFKKSLNGIYAFSFQIINLLIISYLFSSPPKRSIILHFVTGYPSKEKNKKTSHNIINVLVSQSKDLPDDNQTANLVSSISLDRLITMTLLQWILHLFPDSPTRAYIWKENPNSFFIDFSPNEKRTIGFHSSKIKYDILEISSPHLPSPWLSCLWRVKICCVQYRSKSYIPTHYHHRHWFSVSMNGFRFFSHWTLF